MYCIYKYSLYSLFRMGKCFERVILQNEILSDNHVEGTNNKSVSNGISSSWSSANTFSSLTQADVKANIEQIYLPILFNDIQNIDLEYNHIILQESVVNTPCLSIITYSNIYQLNFDFGNSL